MEGHVTNRIGVNSRLIAHNYRDLCCFHLHKEREALLSLKLYGMNPKESEEETSKRDVPKEEALPSSLEAVDAFIDKVTSDSNRISFLDRPGEVVDKSNVDPIAGTSMRKLREEDMPYNTVIGCEIDEVTPQRGEVWMRDRLRHSLFCWRDIGEKCLLGRMDATDH